MNFSVEEVIEAAASGGGVVVVTAEIAVEGGGGGWRWREEKPWEVAGEAVKRGGGEIGVEGTAGGAKADVIGVVF